jgi:PEGA domain-containing protein
MRFAATVALRLAWAALGVALGCRCTHPPCPLPLAIVIKVTAGVTGGPVNGAVVHVSGAAMASVPCNATCYVPGYAGTYSLEIEAPGFQKAQRTVTVKGTNPDCDCQTTITEHLDISLVASP